MADRAKNGWDRWRKVLLAVLIAPGVLFLWFIGFTFLFDGYRYDGYYSSVMYPQWHLMLLTGGLAAFYLVCVGLLFRNKKFAAISFAAMLLCIAAVPGIEAYHHLTVERHKQLVEFIEDNYEPFTPSTRAVKVTADPGFKISGKVPHVNAAYGLYPLAAGVAQALYPPRKYDRNKELGAVGSDYLYNSLLNGDSDIGIGLPPSKEQLEEAKKRGLVYEITPFAREAFVFFVNKRNPVSGLTQRQIRDIYSGRITRWEETGTGSGKIKPFQRNEGSGSQTMLQRIMGDTPLMLPPREYRSTGMDVIIYEVADYRNHPRALGFSFRFFATDMFRNDEIKLLTLDGVAPTRENIRNGSYPFITDICVITVRPRNENTRKIVDFLLSPAGKELVEKTGYTSLAPARAEKLETRFVGERTELVRGGKVWEFKSILAEQMRRHPAMRAEDMLKLCYQGAYGPEHILGHIDAAKRAFDAEYAAVAPRPNEPLFEIISPDFMRVNLGAWKARKLPPEWLFNLFVGSARRFPDGDAVLTRYFDAAETLLDGELKTDFVKLRRTASGAPHHSSAYRAAERPAYRLASTRFLAALPVLERSAELPGAGKEIKVIAVDGRAASGKTTLARQLGHIMGAGTVHMDDFFLPPELRTRERYNEPGGNVHYERFAAEVLPHLREAGGFSYRAFDCSKMAPGNMVGVRPSPWRIVEGAYSLHPRFGEYADLKVFYDIAPEEQKRRIVLRNGEKRWQMFRDRWIPLEELYIKNCDVVRRADLILGGK